MRSGVCTLQQTLTSEAASVLKHSLVLARRRGHAQVTPLHVAATLLSLRASSFRRACLNSQPQQHSSFSSSPPNSSSNSNNSLQCRALELCFNVALNRLPTTPGAPLLHSHHPSLSNALIAALKRAQAHQRRGSIEQQHQQQPLLTVKVELEHLVISILDDPSVSRVMREAGFSSTLVKNNIEDNSTTSGYPSTPSSLFYNTSGGVFSSPSSPSPNENQLVMERSFNNGGFRHNNNFFGSLLFSSPQKKATVFPITELTSSREVEDVNLVLDVFMRKKKRNTVIVGDSVALTEGLVGEIMRKLERGEVPEELKSTHVIKFQLAPLSLRFMKRDEVEMNLSALRRKVDSVAAAPGGGGAIFYVGDLKWIAELASEKKEGDGCGYNDYNLVEHLVGEIGKLFCDSNNTKVWLLAIASYQTYMRCQMRQPSLENQWRLQAVPVPSGGLGLSLHASSVHDSKMTISQNQPHILETKLWGNKEVEQDKLNCCEECATNYEKEAQLFKPGQKKLLPSWLQSHTTEAFQKDEVTQLKRKWNRLCHCLHQSKQAQNTLYGNYQSSNGKIYPYNSSYPWWPNQPNHFTDTNSISFVDLVSKPVHSSNFIAPQFKCQQQKQQSCTIEFNFSEAATTTTLDSLKGIEGNNKEVKITLALGNSTFGGSGEKMEKIATTSDRTLQRAHICKLLQENVPWQCETVASIAEALVGSNSTKQSAITWLFVHGNDSVGKTRLARAIAESVFGSVDDDVLLHLDMLKKEDNSDTPFSEVVVGALKKREKIVILIESFDFADAQFNKFIADGFESEKFETLSSGRAIFILSNGGSRSNEEEQKNKDSVMQLVLKIGESEANHSSSLLSPCLGQKRKAEELDLLTKMKNPRIEKKEQEGKKEYCSFNHLDLNMEANEEEDGGNSPISSDLTRENWVDTLNSNGSHDSAENKFELNIEKDNKEVGEEFLRKMQRCFEEVYNGKGNFSVEERVIEEIGDGCGSFTNSTFEKWLKDIFQSSLLKNVNFGGGNKEGIVNFTLCWGGKGDRKSHNGFMGSCLPKNIQVNYFVD